MTLPNPALDAQRDLVAYFCAEFAVDPRLPIYAGGLGVLAGDHLKTANDVGLPLVAVGLLYLQGYFTQELDGQGNQQALPAGFDPGAAGLTIVQDALGREQRVRVPLAEHEVQARLWRKNIGRIALFLLDANVPENTVEDRGITARLYDAAPDLRLKQEILLGIGGVRALRALGLRPTAWHLNEGHAAFVILERMREFIAWGHGFEAALELVAGATVFTTHTAVPAGHDVFARAHLDHWLHSHIGALHTTERRLFALGGNNTGGDRFSMTALALRGSRFRNGVSRIHGGLAARMESYVWPQVPPELNPMESITNGVHLPTFLAPAWQALLDRHLPHWRSRVLDTGEMGFVDRMPDPELIALRADLRQALLGELRDRLARMHRRLGTEEAALDRILAGVEAAGRGAPIICFARRFATYKRATMLLQDAPRLARLLADAKRPALLLFAGKAHPNDRPGQDMIQRLFQQSLKPEFLGRLIVLEGYDIELAQRLVQGSDLWLNTPDYPLEASGTSGMKAGANGSVNLSVLDGWWAEGYDGANGFAIEPVPRATAEERDREEGRQLFELLEQRVLPEYYGPDGAGPSQEWLRRVRHSVRTIVPRFAATRMLDEYQRRCYAPAADLGRRLEANNGKPALHLARWKRLIHMHWRGAEFRPEPGEPVRVIATTGGIPAESIAIEALDAQGVPVRLRLESGDHQQGRYVLDTPRPPGGIRAFRAYPCHELLAHRFEMGLMTDIAPKP